MKKINELRVGIILSYLNIGISTIIPLLYTPIMLRILGQEEYGLYSLSSSIISYLSLLTFGMGSATIRYMTKCRTENNHSAVQGVVALFFILYSISAVLVCIIGGFFSLNVQILFGKGLLPDEIKKLAILLIIMTISTAVSMIVSVFASIVISYEKYLFSKSIDMLSTVLMPIINLVILFWGYKSIGMALVGMFMQIAYLILFIVYSNWKLKIKPDFHSMPVELLNEILGFSLFVFIGAIVDLLYWSTDKVLIGALVGSAAVAIYNVGGVFTNMLSSMSGAISNVYVPRITSMVVGGSNLNELSKMLIRIGRIQYLIVSLIVSGFIVYGKAFIHFWSGDVYMDSYYIAIITMIPLSIPLIQNIAYNIILAQKKHKFRAVVYAIIAIINVVSTYLVLPIYGIIGAAACTAVAYIIGHGLVMNLYYAFVIKLDIAAFWKNIVKMSVVPLGMTCVFFFVINRILIITNLIEFGIGVIVYTVLFSLLSWFISMNGHEKQLVYNALQKLKLR